MVHNVSYGTFQELGTYLSMSTSWWGYRSSVQNKEYHSVDDLYIASLLQILIHIAVAQGVKGKS